MFSFRDTGTCANGENCIYEHVVTDTNGSNRPGQDVKRSYQNGDTRGRGRGGNGARGRGRGGRGRGAGGAGRGQYCQKEGSMSTVMFVEESENQNQYDEANASIEMCFTGSMNSHQFLLDSGCSHTLLTLAVEHLVIENKSLVPRLSDLWVMVPLQLKWDLLNLVL